MGPAQNPVLADLVLVGGGHANIQVMKKFAMQPIGGLRVTLISDKIYAPYSGMLPGYLLGDYSFEQCHFDLPKICQNFGFRFIHAKVIGVDAQRKKILLQGRPEMAYDCAAINIGIEPKPLENPAHNIVPIKPISGFVKKWKTLLADLEAQTSNSKVAVVGGGAAGVEISLVLSQLIHRMNLNAQVSLFQSATSLVSDRSQQAHKKLISALRAYGVDVHLGQAFPAPNFALNEFDKVLLTTMAQAPSWFESSGLSVNEDGFLKVDSHLKVLGAENLFAAGDCIHFSPMPLKKSGVYAVRQGQILAANIRSLLLKQTKFKKFIPKKNVLSLIVAGPQKAIAHQDSGTLLAYLSPSRLWKFKNWIDLRFMERFSFVKGPMPKAKVNLPEDQWRTNTCGGCGSKVGASVLRSAFQKLGLDSLTEDAAVTKVTSGKLCLQTIDHFRSFTSDPYVFAEIAVHHALSDIYAMGGRPTNLQVGLSLSPGTEKTHGEDIFQTMSGILKGLEASGVELVGGHTNEAAESSLALSVQGEVDEEALLKKNKLSVGDHLVLTKPLGTGVILAGQMELKVNGTDLGDALAHMRNSNALALSCLQEYEVKNCTDVTGFGLAGHLSEMLAGTFGADLDYPSLPVMNGAEDLFNQGLRSSISHKNRDALAGQLEEFITDGSHPFLFDPQTSGGLLFSVPPDKSKDCVAALRNAGFAQTTVVGKVTAGNTGIAIHGGPPKL